MEAEFGDGELTKLVEKSLRVVSTQTVAWLLLDSLSRFAQDSGTKSRVEI